MDERSIAPVGVAGSIPMQNKYLYGKIVVPSLGVCACELFVNAPKKNCGHKKNKSCILVTTAFFNCAIMLNNGNLYTRQKLNLI